MSNLIEKIAVGIGKKIEANTKAEKLFISANEWKKTNKKAQIVDLWHQAEKARQDSNNNYNGMFNFKSAEDNGVDFHLWNSNIGMLNVIKKELDNIGIKYTVHGSEQGGNVIG